MEQNLECSNLNLKLGLRLGPIAESFFSAIFFSRFRTPFRSTFYVKVLNLLTALSQLESFKDLV